MASIHKDVVHLLEDYFDREFEISDDPESDEHMRVSIPDHEAEEFAFWLVCTV